MATKYVSPSGGAPNDGSSWAAAYTTIAAGITGASANDTLEIDGGAAGVTYTETVTVGKALTVIGSSATSHNGVVKITAASGTLLTATAANVRVSNIWFAGVSALTRSIYCNDANNFQLDHCVTDGPKPALVVYNASGVSIFSNKIMDGYNAATSHNISFEGSSVVTFYNNITTPNNVTVAGSGLPSYIRVKDTCTANVYNNVFAGTAGKIADVATSTAVLNFKNNIVIGWNKAVGGVGAILTNTGSGTITETNTCYEPAGERPATTAPYGLGVNATNPVIDTPKFVKQGLGKGYIIITADDGTAAGVAWAQSLETLGIPFTWYIDQARFVALPDSTFTALSPSYANGAEFLQHLVAAGHEIGGHSLSHATLTGTSTFTVTGSRTLPTYNVDRTANTITCHDTEGGDRVVSNFKTKTILAIRTEINAFTGFTTAGTTWDVSYGEILADTAGAKSCSSAYTNLLLKDNTATTGLYKTEVADVKTWLEGLIGGGYTVKTFACPGNAYDATVQAAVKNAGYIGMRGGSTGSGYRDLCSVQVYASNCYTIASYMFGAGIGETEANLTRNGQAAADIAVTTASDYCFLIHGTDNMPIASLLAFINGAKTVPNIEMVTLGTFTAFITNVVNGWSTADSGYTYTKTMLDASDYHLRAGSPCINYGVDVGLTTDYAGNPIVGLPDIGAYEYQPPAATGHAVTANPGSGGGSVRIFTHGGARRIVIPQ